MSYPIVWVPSPKYTPGHPAPLIALVHHRMVGTLVGTDAAFTSPVGVGRAASTNFGIGWCTKHGPRRICIHQYVRLGDQAWGNGNWDASGSWDNRNPTTLINSRTISIEHEDGGNLPAGEGRGVVPEAVIEASIWLDRELLAGRVDGIRFRDEPTMVRELRAIPVDAHHIIDHYYISGRLKPFCWRPWSDDRTGFPQARYLAALGAPPDTSTGDTVKGFLVPEDRTLAKIKDKSWLYVTSELAERSAAGLPAPDTGNIQLSPARELVLIGILSPTVRIVAYERPTGDVDTTSRAMFAKTTDVESTRKAPPPIDTTPFSKAQVDTAYNAGLIAAQSAISAIPRR